MPDPRPAPRAPSLSLLDTTLLVMGSIIGVGVFFTPGNVARLVPDGPWLLALWGLGALIALCGAATFAELGQARPVTGGWFVYLEQAFGPLLSFLFAWTILAVVSTASLAVIADFCAQRIAGLLGGLSPGETVSLSAGLLVFATGLCLAGVRTGARFQNVCMLLKLLAIAALVLAGLLWSESAGALDLALSGAQAALDAAAASPEAPNAALEGASSLATQASAQGSAVQAGSAADSSSSAATQLRLAAALLPILFTYGGWQNICYIAEDVKDPRRNLPRGILLGVLGVAVVYLAINAAYLTAFGAVGLANEPHFAARLAAGAFGPRGAQWVEAAMAISALGILIVTTLVTPGIYVALARRGLWMPAFARLSPATGAPTLGLLTQLALALLYLLWARAFPLSPRLAPHAINLDSLIGGIAFAEWLFHGLAALALLRFRRHPNHPAPTNPLLAAAPYLYFLIACSVVLSNLLSTGGAQVSLGLISLSAGLFVYLTFARRWAQPLA